MCRLLAYAAARENLSLKEVLTPEQIEGFLWMSTIHNDGWGAVHMVDASDSAGIDDGGAPSEDTTTSIYRSTESAFLDPLVEAVTAEPARSAIFHLRLATPGIPLEIENQQPFSCDGVTFMHNGSIENASGNIVDNYEALGTVGAIAAASSSEGNAPTEPYLPVTHEEFERTGGRSDSAVYFAAIIKAYGKSGSLVKAVSSTIADMRTVYPDSSYNSVVQTEDTLIFAHAVGEGPVSKELGKIYTENGFEQHIADYRDIKYRELDADAEGDYGNAGVVIASTGFEQPEEEGWHDLPNNTLIAVNTRTGEYELSPLK
ncbi:MAG: class II glutamine amidotransferase [Bifidobacteriaceae bacterium]|jgi:predicted glutamine amidotransferase|nr:class II glutamine amidotransferase [Bifidobacteriaceae bacterium]